MELMFVRYIIHQFIIKILNLKLKTKKTGQRKSRFKYKLWKRWAVAGGTGLGRWHTRTNNIFLLCINYSLCQSFSQSQHNIRIIIYSIQFNSNSLFGCTLAAHIWHGHTYMFEHKHLICSITPTTYMTRTYLHPHDGWVCRKRLIPADEFMLKPSNTALPPPTSPQLLHKR